MPGLPGLKVQDTLKNIALCLAFLLACLYRFPVDDYRLSMRLLFEIFAGLGFAVYLFRYNKWFALLVAVTSVSMFYPFFDRNSYLAFYAVVIGGVAYLSLRQIRNEWLMDCICVVAVINADFVLNQTFGFFDSEGWAGLILRGGENNCPIGLLCNQNLASALLAFSVPAFLRGWRMIGLMVVIPALVFTKSSGGGVAVAAGVFAYGLLRFNALWQRSLILFACMLLLAGVFVCDPTTPFSLEGRIEVWQFMANTFQVWGVGIGHYKNALAPFLVHGKKSVVAHNEFFQLVYEVGIAGVFLILGLAISCIRKYKQEAVLSAVALIIIATNCLVNFPFHIGTTALIGIAWLSIYDKQTEVK